MASNLNSSLIAIALALLVALPVNVYAWESCPSNKEVRCFTLEEEKERLKQVELGKQAQEQLELTDEKIEQLLKVIKAQGSEKVSSDAYNKQLQANLSLTNKMLVDTSLELEKAKSNTPWIIAGSSIVLTLAVICLSVGYVQAK